MDVRETARFLGRIYRPGDQFEVAYLGSDKAPARVTRVYDGDNGERVKEFLSEVGRAEESGYNVYVSARPQNRGHLYDRIWVDQDDPGALWPFGSSPEWDAPAWPMPNTLVKTSETADGFRWQAIWLLSTPLPEDGARNAMRRLADAVGADKGVHDPRRVLRLPGVLNAKRGQVSRLVESRSGPISIGAFNLPEESALERLMQTKVNDPTHVLGEWLEGLGEGDRSRKAYVCARFLKSCGVTFHDAAAIMKLGAMRCDPIFEDRELEHSLHSAYNRAG